MCASRPLIHTAFSIVLLVLAGVANLGRPLAAAPGDAPVTPGEFVIEHPTLQNLGFEWHIDGDGNRNAKVDLVNGNEIDSNVNTTLGAGAKDLRLLGMDNVNGTGNVRAVPP